MRGAVLGAALLLCAPLIFLAVSPGDVPPMLWGHLRDVMLPLALRETLLLLVGVGALSLTLGIGFAWVVTRHEFPGRRIVEVGLALPLAFPTYVLAYVFVAGLSFDAGPARLWREIGLPAEAFPEIRSVSGTVCVLSLALFPYIYLLMRATLLRHGSAAFDAARLLGASPWRAFFRVVMPATRAAWLGGLGLVLLETLADFGAVRLLGRDTLTTLVIQSWTGLKSLALAAQLALAVLAAVLLVLMLGHRLRGRDAAMGPELRAPRRQVLGGASGWFVGAMAACVIGAGVVWPIVQLAVWWPTDLQNALPWAAMRGTVAVAGLTALTALSLGLLIAALQRRFPADRWIASGAFFSGLGYAVPGAVMAVAVFWCLLAAERALGPMAAGLGLSTGLLALIVALVMRFQRVGLSAATAALSTLRPSLMDSAAVLGHGPLSRWRRIGWPVLRPGLLVAFLLVFVEAMKELPATLMLRPFGWDTLAVEVYTATSEGLWSHAAVPALLLVVVGLVPVLGLIRERR